MTVVSLPTGAGAHDTREAVFNGLDIEMGSYTNGLTSGRNFAYSDYFLARPYLQGLQSGEYPLSTVEDKAARVLRLIFRTAMNRNRPWGSFTSEAHYEAARQIGTEGIVLLKNEPVKRQQPALLPSTLRVMKRYWWWATTLPVGSPRVAALRS